MTTQIMEVLLFNVQPTLLNDGQSLLTNSNWNSALSALTQQNGVQSAYWGQTVESQDKVYLLIDWISTQHRIKFEQSELSKTFRTNIDLIITGDTQSIYVPIAPHNYPRIFQDGVTEIAVFSSFTSSFIDRFDSFSSIIKASQGCTGVAKDIATSKILDEFKGIEESEQFYIAFIGWSDVATHRLAMESEAFKENVPLIEESVQNIIVYHVNLVQV